jgi:putative ABC transport system ATP-binding protein
LTVEENILLPCLLDGRKAPKERLEDILAATGLAKRRRHLPNQLSGGQQQRVSIGRALINDPALVLADEPTGNLDSAMGAEIMELLLYANHKYGQTLVIITHDERVAMQTNRIIRIVDGRIIADDRVR